MVYCGKASQGCQSCRVRRIKCDKVRPDCSQCVRVGKKCPGYRDQLSLMFRDESNKVIQKAHAQWGVGEPESPHSATSRRSSSAAFSNSDRYSPVSSDNPGTLVAVHSPRSPSPKGSTIDGFPLAAAAANQHLRCLSPNVEDQGVQFFVNRYLVGHPDEPQDAGELQSTAWLWSPQLRDVMAAVGLAGLSNLRGDKELMTASRARYGLALQKTGELIKNIDMDSFHVVMRTVVSLAMFELVKGAFRAAGGVTIHVRGAVALIRRWCPTVEEAWGGVKGLLQLCYSMFIHAHAGGAPPPPDFTDLVEFSRSNLPVEEHCVIELGILMSRFVELASFMRGHVLIDGRSKTTSTLKQMVELDMELETWEQDLDERWDYRVEHSDQFSPQAVFQGEYHVYSDLFYARMWGHYRWARLLTNQMILEFTTNYPVSSLPLHSEAIRLERLALIRKLGRDMFVSTPCHWRHPLLNNVAFPSVVRRGAAGSGAAGVPIVVFHTRVAACAPGMPEEYWRWGMDLVESIWGDMGMLHAKGTMEAMLVYREKLQKKEATNDLLLDEPPMWSSMHNGDLLV